MKSQRLSKVISRIEQAAARIESGATSGARISNPALQKKYDTLREEAGQAIAEIDTLIETLEK